MAQFNKHKFSSPLISWDLYMSFYHELIFKLQRSEILKTLEGFKKKFDWKSDVLELFENAVFEAVVLTNVKQEIQYVSSGFKKMTGYPFTFAKGKTPKFLQGELTCERTKAKIRSCLQAGESFKEEIINYRKNGEAYNCLVEVHPIKNVDDEITHFIALEREVKMSA